MIARRPQQRAHARGMVLVTALLMLVVVTILGLAMFRSFGLDEKIAGNLREMFQNITAAGDDMVFRSSVASPTLRIDGMTIAGS